jgi:hypothetical protein
MGVGVLDDEAGDAIGRPHGDPQAHGCARIVDVDEAPPDREMVEQFLRCTGERFERRLGQRIRLAGAGHIGRDDIGGPRKLGDHVAVCARRTGEPVQEQQRRV